MIEDHLERCIVGELCIPGRESCIQVIREYRITHSIRRYSVDQRVYHINTIIGWLVRRRKSARNEIGKEADDSLLFNLMLSCRQVNRISIVRQVMSEGGRITVYFDRLVTVINQI